MKKNLTQSEIAKEKVKQIRLMKNRQLYNEFVELARGDGYDGGFTEMGRFTFDFIKGEMESRLKDWLSK